MNSEMKSKMKRFVVTLLGIFFLGAGVAIDTAAALGTDCMAGFNEAFARTLGYVTFGQMTTIIEILMVIYAYLRSKKTVGIGTVLSMLLVQFPIDLVYNLVPQTQNLVVRILYVLIGILFISLGAEMIIHADLGMGAYEAFMYSFVYTRGWKFIYVKYVCDAIFLLGTVIFRGQIGLGTVITYLLTPKCMELINKNIDRFIRFE